MTRSRSRTRFESPLFDLTRAASLAQLGQQGAAEQVMARILARWPDISVATTLLPPFHRAEDRERYLGALRRVGMPES